MLNTNPRKCQVTIGSYQKLNSWPLYPWTNFITPGPNLNGYYTLYKDAPERSETTHPPTQRPIMEKSSLELHKVRHLDNVHFFPATHRPEGMMVSGWCLYYMVILNAPLHFYHSSKLTAANSCQLRQACQHVDLLLVPNWHFGKMSNKFYFWVTKNSKKHAGDEYFIVCPCLNVSYFLNDWSQI